MEKRKIFISIASFRDRLCSSTIESLISNARFPERITIGVCEQNEIEDRPCLQEKFKKYVKIIRMKSDEAEGPSYARFLCSRLFSGEDYYFQIDSHSKLVKHWDIKILEMMNECESKKPILSHYPLDFSEYNFEPPDNTNVTFIKKASMNHNGVLSFHGADVVKPFKKPKKNYFIAAGFFFAPRQFIKEVPFDPYLPNLFTGEEILLSARAFTHGWDVFSPNRNILYHFYTRKDEPKFWDEKNYKIPSDAELKVKIILGQIDASEKDKIKDPKIRDSIQKYTIGTKRSLTEFYKKISIGTTKISAINQNISILFIFLFLLCIIFFWWASDQK